MDRIKTTRGFRPAIDSLDARRLMAAHLTASLAHGVLTVKGTPASDVISVSIQGPKGNVVAVEGIHKSFRLNQIKRIDVLGGKGDDAITVRTAGRPNLPVRIDGGAGNDTINGVAEIPPASVPVFAPPAAPAAPNPAIGAPQPVSTAPPPVNSPLPQAVARIVSLTNAERQNAGLAPLAVSGPLNQAAEIQSGNMARLDVMSHVLPGTDQPSPADRAAAVGYGFSALGENIAFNYADADAVVAGWMASPGHRANILNADFTEIGVAVAHNAQGEPYYTQVFGRPA